MFRQISIQLEVFNTISIAIVFWIKYIIGENIWKRVTTEFGFHLFDNKLFPHIQNASPTYWRNEQHVLYSIKVNALTDLKSFFLNLSLKIGLKLFIQNPTQFDWKQQRLRRIALQRPLPSNFVLCECLYSSRALTSASKYVDTYFLVAASYFRLKMVLQQSLVVFRPGIYAPTVDHTSVSAIRSTQSLLWVLSLQRDTERKALVDFVCHFIQFIWFFLQKCMYDRFRMKQISTCK